MTRLRGITGIRDLLDCRLDGAGQCRRSHRVECAGLGLHHSARSDGPARLGAGASRRARRRPGHRGEVQSRISRRRRPPENESIGAAAAAAAYTVLSDSRICPDSAQPTLDTAFAPYLAGNDAGLAVGYAAGNKLLTASWHRPARSRLPARTKSANGARRHPETRRWRFPWLKDVEPFAMTKPSQFRPGPPPAMDSRQYLREYNEVKEKGSIANHPTTGACPAPADTDLARFWAGNFVVQWNQAARDIALDRQLSTRRHGAIARANQPRRGGRGNRRLGLQVLLQLLAADDRDPAGRRGPEQPHGRRSELASVHREPEPLPTGRLRAKSGVPGLRVRRERAHGSLHHDVAAVLRHGLGAVRGIQGPGGSDGSYLH